jgi:hypothetical protein
MEWYYVVPLTLLGAAVLKLIVLLIVGRGSLGRFGLALKMYVRTLSDAAFAEKAQGLLAPPPPPKPVKLSGEPLRLLALLQRKGRLLDFLLEDISGASDEQIGAGVRELHKESQAVLKEHLSLAPVLAHQEGDTVEAPPGFDPSAVRLTGNVTGQPPFRGVLKHHGWRVTGYRLAAPPEGQDELVIAPAEVDLP